VIGRLSPWRVGKRGIMTGGERLAHTSQTFRLLRELRDPDPSIGARGRSRPHGEDRTRSAGPEWLGTGQGLQMTF
jgi:hypothetical protein